MTHNPQPRAFASTEWFKQTTQSLRHHNFAIIRHSVMRFSGECSEKIVYMNTAVVRPLNIVCVVANK